MKDEREILWDALAEAERNLTDAYHAARAKDWARCGRGLLGAAASCKEAYPSTARLLAEEQEKEKQT